MKTKLFLLGAAALGLIMPGLKAKGVAPFAAEKVNFGSPTRGLPNYDLPFIAAEEKGIWKSWGLEVNWVIFNATTPLVKALVSKDMDIGAVSVLGSIPAVIQGAPLTIVAHHGIQTDFRIFVRGDGPIKTLADLKGTKIGVLQLGGATHRMGQVAVKALGLEKEVKFVSVGGGPILLAALRSGAVDAAVLGFDRMAPLMVTGAARDVVIIRKYLPSPWQENQLLIHRDRLERNPEPLKKATRAFLQAATFVGENAQWAVGKLKANYGHSEEVAKSVYAVYRYDGIGRTDPVALENVAKFMKEYGIIPKDAPVSIEKLYTNRFLE